MGKASLTVKDVAEQLGISSKTLKKLEANGTFPPARRNNWGHRIYENEEVKRLRSKLAEYQKMMRETRGRAN